MRYLSFVIAVVPCAAAAQQPSRSHLADSSARIIMAHVGPHVRPFELVAILRDKEGRTPTWKQNEIADSLVARAVAYRPTPRPDTVQFGAAVRAVMALSLAGSASTGVEPGEPYTGALDHLIRIHEEARASEIRSRALEAMLGGTDRARGLAYMRSVAVSVDPTAYKALSCLIMDSRGGGVGYRATESQRHESFDILVDLATHHLVKDPVGARDLELWYASQSRPHAAP